MTNMRAFSIGPEWDEISIPDWFKERTEALTAQIGDDSPEAVLFKDILAKGHLTKDALASADKLAGDTQTREVFLLAVDIATHGFTVLQAIPQLSLLQPKAA